MPGDEELLSFKAGEQLNRKAGKIREILTVHHIAVCPEGEKLACKISSLVDRSLAIAVKGHRWADAVQVYVVFEDLIVPRPPFHAVAVHLMSSCRQPSGEFIDPFFRSPFYPGVDGVVNISDLHRASNPAKRHFVVAGL